MCFFSTGTLAGLGEQCCTRCLWVLGDKLPRVSVNGQGILSGKWVAGRGHGTLICLHALVGGSPPMHATTQAACPAHCVAHMCGSSPVPDGAPCCPAPT